MLLLILLAFVPACLGFSQCGHTSPGDMAHQLFQDADKDHDGILALGEMLFLFDKYDANQDGRVTRHEFLTHVRQTEPELEPWYNMLYDTFDMDGDHHLDLHDFVNLYMNMDPEHDNHVTEFAFIGYWTVLYTALVDLHPNSC